MLHLEIQRGKDGMRGARHNGSLGATAGCTLRLLEGAAGIASTGHGIKGDAWFGSVRTAMEIGVRGNEAVLQVKTNSGLYPKKFIEDALTDAPGGVSIVLAGTAPNEQKLIAIGYRYSRKTTLFFVMTAGAGSTKPGRPYIMKYTDGYGNLCSREVERPAVLSDFFEHSNTIDRHNQSRQYDLALEKSWVTKDCFFRLSTTLIGIHVTDAWKLADYHKIINFSKKEEKKMPISMFVGILGWQLVHNAPFLSHSVSVSRFASPAIAHQGVPIPAVTVGLTSLDGSGFSGNVLSSVSDQNSPPKVVVPFRTLKDVNDRDHHLMKLPLTADKSGKRCTQARQFMNCKKQGIRHDVVYYCFTCGLSANFCCPDEYQTSRDCVKHHVDEIRRDRAQTRSKPMGVE